MTTKALIALIASIEHWERLANGTQAKGEGIWAEDCPLCAEFSKPANNAVTMECFGCPVYERTHFHGCEGSPWHKVADVLDEDQQDRTFGSKDFKAAAQKQLDFLKSLLPKLPSQTVAKP